MQNNRITVITVCFNAAPVIEQTMQSVLNQTYKNLEYIIIDGLSTDSTMDIVKNVSNRYPHRNIRYVSEPDNGVWDAMNKGIRMSSGEWVNIMNAGDYYVDENVLENILNDPLIADYSMIFSDYELRYRDHNLIYNASLEKGTLLHQAIIYRKKLHNIYGYYAVTKTLTCSDTLFFCLVPDSDYYKTKTMIASYDMTGISNQGNSYGLKVKAVHFVFNKISFKEILIYYVKEYLKERCPQWIWCILHVFNKISKICLKRKD